MCTWAHIPWHAHRNMHINSITHAYSCMYSQNTTIYTAHRTCTHSSMHLHIWRHIICTQRQLLFLYFPLRSQLLIPWSLRDRKWRAALCSRVSFSNRVRATTGWLEMRDGRRWVQSEGSLLLSHIGWGLNNWHLFLMLLSEIKVLAHLCSAESLLAF